MSESSPHTDKRASFASFGERRPGAFIDAGRHTARVQFFRRAIIVGCVSAACLLGFVLFFDPLHRMQLGFSVARVGLEGSRITMEKPRLSGFRNDNEPYEVKAQTVVQDTKKSRLFELRGVDARLGMKDGSTLRLEAAVGLYHSDSDLLELSDTVRIHNVNRFDMTLERADVDMKTGKFVSDTLILVTLPGGRVEAKSVAYSESTGVVAFSGGVHSEFLPGDDRLPQPAVAKESQ